MQPQNEQDGELIVNGHDKIEIHLKDFPRHVDVHFKHKNAPPPCDPQHGHHSDRLSWEVHRKFKQHHYHYVLIIKWHVSVVREILWHTFY